uniref:Uncharacterized protein n=1 Tax=Chromera velia CCMP2878 TaxID=1169474 RepID=A0A0G4F9Q0_9ALVE|eukprot:Cvel_15755.t1-p1 / transcript=Cvel_15755.t1 / gene=Cvel_15755 / organism=Chromera_velia_CCMP2878 / gene_product=hypothetical protein / transcript_product=hypothetical protein / location=Cvel_scaffold1180:13288-20986(+) / protein_length=989 / sequence_SO=supercontig / SO=protein_coding / is_pseudo=false
MPTGPPDEVDGETSGEGSTDSVHLNVELDTGWPSPISAAALGESHSLVVAGGRVMSFGHGIGLGFEFSRWSRYIPTEIPGLTDVRDVCAGKDFSLALLNNGSLLTWGKIVGEYVYLPKEVDTPEGAQWNGTVTGIACGEEFSTAWTDTGALYSWSVGKKTVCLPKSTTPTSRPIQVEALRDVKVVGAVGYRDQLLILPEDPGMFFLCGIHAELGEGDEKESAVISRKDSSAPKVLLPSIRGFENHKVVGAALGECELTGKSDGDRIKELPLRDTRGHFIFLILEKDGEKRRLFVLGADGKEVLTWDGESLYDFAFSDKGGVSLDVLEVGVQKNRALILLSDNSVRAFKVRVENSRGFFLGTHLVVEKPVPVEALHNSALRLAKTISVGTNWIVITKEGPMGPFLPGGDKGHGTAQYGIGEGFKALRLLAFGPLEPPVLAKGVSRLGRSSEVSFFIVLLAPLSRGLGRWCRLPEEFNNDREDLEGLGQFPKELVEKKPKQKKGFSLVLEEAQRIIGPKRPYWPRQWVEVGDVLRYACMNEPVVDQSGSLRSDERGLLYPPQALRQKGSMCTQTESGGEAEMVPALDEIECRGCEMPPEWNGAGVKLASLPFSVKDKGKPSASDDDWKPYEPPIGIGWQIRFDCPNGVLSSENATCTRLGDRAVFSPNETRVSCDGCRTPSWIVGIPANSSDLLPMTVEVRKKNVSKRSLVGTKKAAASEEGEEVEAEEGAGVQEAEDEWRKYEAWEAMGVGDRLRFRCDSGALLQKRRVLSALDQEADEQFSTSGVECQWVDPEKRRQPSFLKLWEFSSLYCRGCSVPRQWLRGQQLWGTRYIVEASSIGRAGGEERESFQPNMTAPVAINDTLFFTCPKGGVLHIDGKPKVRGGATCVDPFGSREFDVGVSDVKCVRSTGATLGEVCLWTFFALLLAVAVCFFVWYSWKEKWRRRKIARQLNLQRLLVPPEGADVSEMVTERPCNLAKQETRARRRSPL